MYKLAFARSVTRATSSARLTYATPTGLRLFSSTNAALDDGTVRSQIKRRKRSSALQEAFKFGDDDDDDMTHQAILESRKKGTKAPVIEEAPDLKHLSKRWNKIDPLEQEEIALYLEQRMRGEWSDLTKEEKQASK